MGIQDSIIALRNGLVQSDRLLKLDTPLGDNVLLPQRLVGHARIGRDSSFSLDAVSTSDAIELKNLVAQAVTLWIQQSDKSYLPHHAYVNTARRPRAIYPRKRRCMNTAVPTPFPDKREETSYPRSGWKNGNREPSGSLAPAACATWMPVVGLN